MDYVNYRKETVWETPELYTKGIGSVKFDIHQECTLEKKRRLSEVRKRIGLHGIDSSHGIDLKVSGKSFCLLFVLTDMNILKN